MRLPKSRLPVERDPARPDVPFRLVDLEERATDAGRRYDTPLIGRLPELAELRLAFGEARDERRTRVATVVGEAGIGKTRLARELIRELRSEATVLVGRCVSYGEGATYLPVAEMVAQAGGNLESIIGGSSSTGTELVALRSFFGLVARERPAVLVFEDIHWAEPTLLDLIEHLGDRLDEPIFILSLARPDAVRPRSMPGMSIVLERFDDEQTLAFISALGGSPEPGVAARIADIAEGNPLYAEQLLAYVGGDRQPGVRTGLARGAAREPLRQARSGGTAAASASGARRT